MQPGQHRTAIGLIEDFEHGATNDGCALFFQHLREFFELPAFGQRDCSTLKPVISLASSTHVSVIFAAETPDAVRLLGVTGQARVAALATAVFQLILVRRYGNFQGSIS